MAQIRILHVVGKMHRGGMETLIMNIYRKIDKEKIQFDFLVHYDEAGEYDSEILSLGGQIYKMPYPSPKNYFKYKKQLNKFFCEHNDYKAIHGHLISTAFIYHKIAKKYGKPVCISHAHTNSSEKNFKSMVTNFTSRLAQKHTDVFFGCSQSACQFFFEKAIKQGKPMTIIKNGIDTQKYIFNSKVRNDIREKLNLGDAFVVGHIGRLHKQKNHSFLLEVFSNILKTNENSILLLCGDGEERQNIIDLAKTLNIDKNIIMLGSRGDVNDVLQAMDVFVLPSMFEGLGIALIEAQCSGLKSFCSDTVIPKDPMVTDLLEYIPLDKTPEFWAKTIVPWDNNYKRCDTSLQIIDHGYDIINTVKLLEEFYFRC